MSGFVQITIPSSIDHNGTMSSSLKRHGMWGWIFGVLFTGFYVLLYWWPEYISWMTAALDPLSQLMRSKASDRWFLYGTLYTGGVLVMGVRMLKKHHDNRYQQIRTATLMLVQLMLAYLIPAMLVRAGSKEYFFSYFWPLKPEYLFPTSFSSLISSGDGLLVFMAIWTLALTLIATPVLTYYYGKRWYCSWVCGCGALAETVGDPFRQNSDKSLLAWKIERWSIHSVLVAVTLLTTLLWVNSVWEGSVFGEFTHSLQKAYGFYIGAIFSGIVGVGFYPILGSRVWCRFGCPQAAILGLIQRSVSKFRITTNGGQCISCGNCSTYCEMGIDVRAYAQRGEDIKRASCVGCGICADVCPRGVLKLENK